MTIPTTMIPYGKQDINDEDISAVLDVLKSNHLTQGPKVPEFEKVVASYCGAKYATATNSATSALHIACLALGLGKGDTAWTSPISFVASSNCALYCGAKIDFVDINTNHGNICMNLLSKKLKQSKVTGCLPKVIIAVHLAGNSCDMETLKELSLQYKFSIIEDASHAIGATYKQHTVGSCYYSDITIFSFHPVKIVTSAEGGIALTNDQGLFDEMNMYRSHGVTADEKKMTEKSHGPWYYQQVTLGFNYRMTELQAALGISQFKRLDSFVHSRNSLAKTYDNAFKNGDLHCLTPAIDTVSSYHLYIVLLPNILAHAHTYIIQEMRNSNIFAHVHYIPIHLQPYYQQLGFKHGDYLQAEDYYSRAISLPLHPGLTSEEQKYIIDTFQRLIGEAKREIQKSSQDKNQLPINE